MKVCSDLLIFEGCEPRRFGASEYRKPPRSDPWGFVHKMKFREPMSEVIILRLCLFSCQDMLCSSSPCPPWERKECCPLHRNLRK